MVKNKVLSLDNSKYFTPKPKCVDLLFSPMLSDL